MTTSEVAQVGGDHYNAPGLQHWDLMELYDIAYLEATASKYVVRYTRKANPRQDIEKAQTYIQKIVASGRKSRRILRCVDWSMLEGWCHANNMNPQQQAILYLILCPQEPKDWDTALALLDGLARGLPEDVGSLA